MPAIGQEDVPRLDVAMDDAVGVGRVQGVGDLDADVHQLMDLERTGQQPIAQGLPLHQLHDDEGVALVIADVVDGADVRVVQGGGGARFGPQPDHGLLAVRRPPRRRT